MRVVVGLGANLGDRLATLASAVRALAEVTKVLAVSRIYETAPIGPLQPMFLNAAIYVECTLEPLALLTETRRVEAAFGRCRAREVHQGPRTLDLDILWIDGLTVSLPTLTVPHPRLRQRAFAVAPLLEVVPGAVDPETREPYVVPSGQGIRVTELALVGA